MQAHNHLAFSRDLAGILRAEPFLTVQSDKRGSARRVANW